MTKKQILNAFRSLASCQGSYGRILENITDEQLEHLEEQGFNDIVDLVLYIES